MPTYTNLTWNDSDQLTSVKFQQMSGDSDWLLGNTISAAALSYTVNGNIDGAINGLRGRSPGIIQSGIWSSLNIPAPVQNPTTLSQQALQAWGPISMCGVFCAYDSPAPSVEYEVVVPLPVQPAFEYINGVKTAKTTGNQPYFAAPPIFSVTVARGQQGPSNQPLEEIAYISDDYSTTELRVHLVYRDGVVRNFSGVLHVLCLGVVNSLPSQSYLPVVWQADDEVLASKLQQMQTNTQWVHDNTLLQPQLVYEVSPSSAAGDTNLRGRTAGTIAATKICGVFCAYDSPTPVASYTVVVPLPPSFFSNSTANTPIYSVSVATGTLQEIAYISGDQGFPPGVPSEVTVTLVYRDGIARNFSGVLHVIALGF